MIDNRASATLAATVATCSRDLRRPDDRPQRAHRNLLIPPNLDFLYRAGMLACRPQPRP